MEWISVEERLPENCDHDWVLAQVVEERGYMHIPIDTAELMAIADEVTFMGFQAVERKKSFMDLISTMLKQCTPIEAEPVKHGRWIGTADGYADGELVYDMWECSECGYDADGADEKPNWNYCPNCGALMED